MAGPWSLRVLAAGLVLALGGPAAVAQTGTAPAPFPTQVFKAWALDCLIPKSGSNAGTRVCFIHHEVRAQADPKLVAARAVIRRAGPERKLALLVQLPPNTVQSAGATIAIDGGTPSPIAISGCITQFCYGALELTPTLEAAVKVGHEMAVGFTPQDHAAVSVPVPLSGVTAALAALEQTGS